MLFEMEVWYCSCVASLELYSCRIYNSFGPVTFFSLIPMILRYQGNPFQAEVRKREEKEAAEALKRERELEEARRQQKRLDFLLSQTELYSHFMQNKSAVRPSEAFPDSDENINDQEIEDEKVEEDPEDAELKKEALRAAQDAVSKQKKLTSAFDDECMKLRQANDLDVPSEDASAAASSNIDLLHP